MKIRCLCKWKSVILKFFIIFFIIFGIMNSINVYAATYDNGKMWYSTDAYYTFNVKGYYNGSLLKTTYSDRGYETYLKIGSNEYSLEKFSDNGASQTINGIQITLNLSTVSGGNYVKIQYTVTNTNSSTKTISLATGADIMIGGNDRAPIENLPGNKGIRMSGDGAQFMFIGRNSYGVTDVDTYWFGYYYDWKSNKYNQSYTYQGSSTDSGMAWSWKNRSIAPGETQKYSVLIGIGELNNAPTINITSSVKDTYYRGEVVNIQGTVNDVDYGDVVRVKYAVDDGIEYEIDQSFTPNGTETPFDLNFSIPTNLSVGNHVLKIWAVDDKGNMSSPKVVNFNLSPFAPPTVPTYKNITNNSFTVEWGTNGNNAGIIYELYDVISNVTVYSGTETSVTLSGFGPNEMRQYKARSKNDHGQYSDYTSVTTVYTLANQPISKGYDNITSNSVRLLWNPNGNPSYTTYHYEVRRKSDNSLVAQGTVNGTSVTVTGLSGGHEQYRFFVRAINGDGVYTDFTELIIPNLVVYQKSNYAKAEWSIEMLDENILIDTSFEDSDEFKPTFETKFPVFEEEGISHTAAHDNRYLQSTIRALDWISKNDFESGNYTSPSSYIFGEKYSTYYKMNNGTYRLEHNKYTNGMQEFTNQESYTGQKSYKIGRTIDRMGNAYWYPRMYTNQSYGTFPRTTAISNGVDLSLTFRAKTDNKATISPIMYGGMASWTHPFHEKYNLPNPLVVTKAASVGEKKIYISGIEQLNPNSTYYVARRQSRTEYVNHSFAKILEINKNEGYIVLQSGITEDFPVGYVLHSHINRTPVTFGDRTIYAQDGWQLFSINAKVIDYEDYRCDLLGLELWFYVTSEGNTYIDDVKLGFATKAELYRDGNKIYEGFLSDYDDYEATDKAKPNSISVIDVKNTGNQINISFDEPTDQGTIYSYQVKAVKHNEDVISSEIKSVTITSDIKGYSYVIDSNPDTVPDDIVDITTPEINHTINPNVKNYIHIKVIDNEGNASEVFHQEIGIPTLTVTPKHQENYIKLDWDIMDTSKTYKYDVYKKLDGQSLYDKISSNNSNKTLNDYTGKDVAGPTKPTITNVSMINSGNTIHIEYTGSTDKGSKYYYYVEGTAPNTKVKSNIADATIISGLQGYSIVVDQNPDTIPDNVIETTELSFNINQKFYQKFYVHVAAVDNAGNISEVAHFECTDVNPPTLNITGNATNWTNQDVVLTAVAHDNESGVKGIKLPDDTWVYSDTATFVVTNNGSYTFIAEDNFGNQTSVTVIVNKIDKTPPLNTSIIINNNDLYTNNRDVVLTVSAEDNATGVSEMRFRTENSPWSAWVPYATTYNYTMDAGFTHQGTNRVYVQFKDGVGNVGGDAFDSIIFDNIAPTGEIIYPKNTTNTRSITLTINAYDINPANADAISGLNSVRFRELQDGEVKQDWTSWEQHNFTRNWILSDGDGVKVIEMEVKDNAGNIGKVTKSIVLDTLFIKEALFTDIVNPPLGNPELPTSEVVKVKKGYEFTFIVKTTGEPDYATYTFNGETGYMIKLADNLFTKTLKVDINDDSVNNELLPINITVARNDGAQKTTTLKVHVEGSVHDDFNINLTN
mgnify:CR=1 FL=1